LTCLFKMFFTFIRFKPWLFIFSVAVILSKMHAKF